MSPIKRKSAYNGILHEVVEHNGTLYFAGIVAENLKADIKGQAEDVMRQLDALLKANGSDMTRILQATLYMTDLKLKPGLNEVWKKWIGAEHVPGRAAIGVADLEPGVLLEMVVIAAKA